MIIQVKTNKTNKNFRYFDNEEFNEIFQRLKETLPSSIWLVNTTYNDDLGLKIVEYKCDFEIRFIQSKE